MKFNMPKPNGAFKFALEGKDIANTCSRILELTKEASSAGSIVQHLIGVSKGFAFCLGYSPEALVVERIGIGQGDGFASIDMEAVRDITKSKKTVEIENGQEELLVSSGRSKSKLPISTCQPDTVAYVNIRLEETAQTVDPLPANMLACLIDGTKSVEIKDVFKLEKTLITHLVCRKGKPLQVFSFDQHHAVTYQSDVKGDRDFRLAMPSKLFQIVSKFATKSKDDDTRFFIDSSGLRLEATDYTMILPPVQTNKNDVDMMLGFEDMLRTWAQFKMPEEMVDSIKSSLSLADPNGGSSFEVKITTKGKGKVNTRLVTARGESEERYPLKNSKVVEDITVKIDPRLLTDIIRKVKGDVTTKVCGLSDRPSVILLRSSDKVITCWSSIL